MIPKTIVKGIPLFYPGEAREYFWELIKSEAFYTGVVNLIYEKVK